MPSRAGPALPGLFQPPGTLYLDIIIIIIITIVMSFLNGGGYD